MLPCTVTGTVVVFAPAVKETLPTTAPSLYDEGVFIFSFVVMKRPRFPAAPMRVAALG
jgi:hypothetical protein